MKLSHADINKLQSIAMGIYSDSTRSMETAEIWFEAVSWFLAHKKYELVPGYVKSLEKLVMEKGLARKYFTELCDSAIRPTKDMKILLSFIEADLDDRLYALSEVFGVPVEQLETFWERN